MYYEAISDTSPKAKVNHQCIWCGEDIKIGEIHRRIVSKYMGDFQDHRFHSECVKPCHMVCMRQDGEFQPHDNMRGSVEAKP